MVTLRHRMGFTATRSTGDLFAWKYGHIVMGRPRTLLPNNMVLRPHGQLLIWRYGDTDLET